MEESTWTLEKHDTFPLSKKAEHWWWWSKWGFVGVTYQYKQYDTSVWHYKSRTWYIPNSWECIYTLSMSISRDQDNVRNKIGEEEILLFSHILPISNQTAPQSRSEQNDKPEFNPKPHSTNFGHTPGNTKMRPNGNTSNLETQKGNFHKDYSTFFEIKNPDGCSLLMNNTINPLIILPPRIQNKKWHNNIAVSPFNSLCRPVTPLANDSNPAILINQAPNGNPRYHVNFRGFASTLKRHEVWLELTRRSPTEN